jgi:hypothetical protein
MFELPLVIAIVMAITEGVKKVGLPAKFSPIVAIVFGVAAGMVYVEGDMSTKVFYGVAIGLSSAGLFDITKVARKDK